MLHLGSKHDDEQLGRKCISDSEDTYEELRKCTKLQSDENEIDCEIQMETDRPTDGRNETQTDSTSTSTSVTESDNPSASNQDSNISAKLDQVLKIFKT